MTILSRTKLGPDKEHNFEKEVMTDDVFTHIRLNICTKADAFEAFGHHPKIGDLSTLEKKFASTAKWAGNEQKAVAGARIKTLQKLALGNAEYKGKFGYIFIVFASGKSAEEMLVILEDRLKNDAVTGQGLLNFFLRGLNCGAISEEDALLTGLTLDELRSRSFLKIMEGRRSGK